MHHAYPTGAPQKKYNTQILASSPPGRGPPPRAYSRPPRPLSHALARALHDHPPAETRARSRSQARWLRGKSAAFCAAAVVLSRTCAWWEQWRRAGV
jgi:hypothetical protein